MIGLLFPHFLFLEIALTKTFACQDGELPMKVILVAANKDPMISKEFYGFEFISVIFEVIYLLAWGSPFLKYKHNCIFHVGRPMFYNVWKNSKCEMIKTTSCLQN